MFASIAVLTTTDLLVAYLPAIGESVGLSSTAVGMLLAVRAGASLASRVFLTMMTRRFGRGRVLVLSTVLPAVTLAPLMVVNALPLLVVLMLIAGFGLGIGQPLSLVWITETAPEHARGTAVGVRLTGNRFGQVVVPAMVAGIVGSAGVGAVFVAMSVMLAGSQS